jgi:hypothetical protein
MANIVKHEKNEIYLNDKNKVVIPKNLPISSKNRELYLSNKNHPRIKLIDDKNVVVKSIHTFINQTIMDKGVNMQPEEIQYLLQRVTDDIIRDYSHYTLEEIRLAFYYGVRGELGEYFGINPVTLYGWLKNFKYELMPQANKAIQKFLPKPKEAGADRSQKEIDQSIAETIYDVYFRLVTEGQYDFYDFGNVCYNLLDSLGIITFTNKEKIELLKESRSAFRKTILDKNRDLTLKDRSIQKIDTTRAFKQLEEQNNPTFEHQVKIGAKRLALYKCLYQLAQEEVDIKQLIENKLSEKKYQDESE